MSVLSEFLKNSITFKKNGTPIVFYHASTFREKIHKFNLDSNGCLFFSTSADVATNIVISYKKLDNILGLNIYPVYLNISKPFDPMCESTINLIYDFVESYYIKIKERVKSFIYRKLDLLNLEELNKYENIQESESLIRLISQDIMNIYKLKENKKEFIEQILTVLSKQNGWMIFEYFLPELIAFIKELNFDSIITYENCQDNLDFNVVVFTDDKVLSVFNNPKNA